MAFSPWQVASKYGASVGCNVSAGQVRADVRVCMVRILNVRSGIGELVSGWLNVPDLLTFWLAELIRCSDTTLADAGYSPVSPP